MIAVHAHRTTIVFLEGLPVEQRSFLDSHRTQIAFKRGEYVYKEGMFVSGLFCLSKGKAALLQSDENGNALVTGLYKATTFMGLADTPEKLSRYISNNGLDANNWFFLTDPSKEKIYDLGWHGFQLAMAEDNDSPGGFIHSEKFVLVDQNGHIRGFYVGTDSEDVSRLAADIRLLLEQPPVSE